MSAAAAVLMEEELQQSMVTSEDDGEFEEDDDLVPDIIAESAHAHAAETQLQNGIMAEQRPQWESNGEDEDEEEVEVANPNRCIFCQQDEENDPSEEFELYLACEMCGDNGNVDPVKIYHRQG
ncbi:hypothetical protein CJF31_00000395 [Rutstroemia sp. NJR-2017a BVV2]|nr:hypothetical protein CJF31_00000395 [Rutstroemia sp. NJR-2017a BVV2]